MRKPKMRAELTEITPGLALKWLDLNKDNRNISEKWVAAIAADISADKWDPNNASIGIRVNAKDEPELVVDGQHRLWAVSEAKKSIWTWVIFGDEASLRRENIDRVKPRSIADQLQLIDHVSNAQQISAWCSVLKALEEGSVNATITLEQAREIRLRHLESLEWLQSIAFAGNLSGRKRVRKAGVAGALLYCYPTSREKVDLFTKQVRDGENISRQDPAYALRTYLERISTDQAAQNRGMRHEVTVLTMRAALAFIKGEQLSALKPGAILGGSFFREACKFFARAHQKASVQLPLRRAAGGK